MLLKPETVFLVIDTETTGFDKDKDKVCQVAAVWCQQDGVPIKTYESLVDPGIPIPAEASAVHHLVDEDVKGAKSLKDALREIEAKGRYDVIVAHNLEFDSQFIPTGTFPTLCTMKLARHLYPDATNHKNQYLRYHLKLSVPEAKGQMAHSALPDCLVTAKLLARELKDAIAKKGSSDVDLEGLKQWADKPVLQKTCRFGKHIGKPWSEVPRDYLQWALKNMQNLSPDLKFTMEHWSK